MSRADEIFIANCRDILENGVWDTDREVRPRWEDGAPAHTIKKFCIVNRYDLREEFPILTIRRTYLKSAIDEILWIWQKKSNNIHDLSSHIWDSWADGSGSIGKAYGYQLGKKYEFREGVFDQVDKVLYDLKHTPASRRIIAHMYNVEDLKDMHLYPCAYSMTFNVSGNTLNGILNQRSQDMLAASNWNVVQRSSDDVCKSRRARSGGVGARGRGRTYLRSARTHRGKDHPQSAVPCAASDRRRNGQRFLSIHKK